MGKAMYSILLIAHFKKQPSKPVVKLHHALSNNPEMFPGKTHPNAAGTKLMAQTIRAALTKKQK